ncbi:MAG: gamma carbonic anhydrase family protein [Janthinobacterium lividum]
MPALILPVRGVYPEIPADCFVADNATVVGDVVMGPGCTVWFTAVVRGDVNSIRIGAGTNIQDGAVLHCTYQGASLTIGARVSIGHRALVHGCTVADDVLIGMGAVVMDHTVVGAGCLIAAGAVVLEHTVCEPGYLYAGVPARRIKPVSEAQRASLRRTAENYQLYASWFAAPTTLPEE